MTFFGQFRAFRPIKMCKLLDIGTGHKSFLARPGQNHNLSFHIVSHALKGSANFPKGLFIQRIELVWSVDSEEGNSLIFGQCNTLHIISV